ncbi:TIGR04197 family type VII secretion effector [Streptococcus chenjunshii]|uniref:TIGR04197 family type VII secretion effector n=1 Tax=Streptococcus chenjunshii TaxID=2173853 RepID=A0A372KIW4_9STRE|nr:TIGR04197 family type VII secretion effector [Streptococcus chenjunshii]AXQ79542.1 TIGR04197 family type VII secretion effector [Streptococcus chenjunshii]RFU51457.1 TIGR04197 family type VII secretion effector [Streptococcus chenjunshii]RFU52231.1 TIGR04197 family type VII secretion effector [Streptococcus chenjunshii]
MTIQSNQTTPSMCATGIMSSVGAVNNGGTAVQDTVSVIQGNESMKSHITNEASLANSVGSKIGSFVSTIQGVANEFDVLDSALSQQIAEKQSGFIYLDGMSSPSQTASKSTSLSSSYTEGIGAPPWEKATASEGTIPNTSLFGN